MNIPSNCPGCGASITSASLAGLLRCEACEERVWYCELNGDLVAATGLMLESRYGHQQEDFLPDEWLDLLRAFHDEMSQEPWHVWEVKDHVDDSIDVTGTSTNPYETPRTLPQRTDPYSETFVLRAVVPCDEETLEWATSRYSLSSDLSGLVLLGCMICVAGIGVLFNDNIEAFFDKINLGWLGIFAVALLGLAAFRWLPKHIMAPYARLLRSRCQTDPLMSADYFWVAIRRSSMTAFTEETVITWPLRQVRCRQHDDHQIVLRVGPKRLLFVCGNSSTMPEEFMLFNKLLRKRLRKYWTEHFFHFEID